MQATSNDYYIASKLLPLGDVLCWPPDSIFQSVNAITVQKRGKLEKFIQSEEKEKKRLKANWQFDKGVKEELREPTAYF